MSVRVALDLPEEAFSALRTSPEDFARQMRIAAAVKWFELGMISQGKAAEIAGNTRAEFMEACSRLNVSPFQTTPEELAEEAARE
jgi:predicted HTH domain antitoxin